ncbi:MAG: SDR family oxidoreductase [Janthinobacterium lividum]
MTTLAGKTIFITGGSRGIGRAIALRAAGDGANIVIAAKTDKPHPKLPGTIHSVAQEIVRRGGQALPIAIDIRDDDAIVAAVARTVERFGSLDILVNNASALNVAKTSDLPMNRFDLMFDINVRGTFATTKACFADLRRASNPHVLTLSPPLDLVPRWFGDHCAYTMSKYAMSMSVLGFAEELRPYGIGVNALWPRTMIATAAMGALGVDTVGCRTPDIMADAAYAVLIRDGKHCTGNFFIDEDVLRASGSVDFERYSVTPGAPLTPDLFVR